MAQYTQSHRPNSNSTIVIRKHATKSKATSNIATPPYSSAAAPAMGSAGADATRPPLLRQPGDPACRVLKNAQQLADVGRIGELSLGLGGVVEYASGVVGHPRHHSLVHVA